MKPEIHSNNRKLQHLLGSIYMRAESDDIAPENRKSIVDFNPAVNDFQKNLIRRALKKTNGVKTKAAAILRMNRTTLVEEIKIMRRE